MFNSLKLSYISQQLKMKVNVKNLRQNKESVLPVPQSNLIHHGNKLITNVCTLSVQ